MCTTRSHAWGTQSTVSENPAPSQTLLDSGVLGQQIPVCDAITSALQQNQWSELAFAGLAYDSVTRPPASLTDSTFDAYIAQIESLTLVKFSAAWCEGSISRAPHFATAAEQLLGGRFANVDIDVCPTATRANAVRTVPTLILYRNGQELARHSGVMPVHILKHWVHASLITDERNFRHVANSSSHPI